MMDIHTIDMSPADMERMRVLLQPEVIRGMTKIQENPVVKAISQVLKSRGINVM